MRARHLAPLLLVLLGSLLGIGIAAGSRLAGAALLPAIYAPLLYLTAAGALALLVAAIGALLASWRGGEMRGQSDKIAAAAKEYREKRTRNDER